MRSCSGRTGGSPRARSPHRCGYWRPSSSEPRRGEAPADTMPGMTRVAQAAGFGTLLALFVFPVQAQEARRRWEMERQIRLDKFEQVLPRAMRDNGIDMWIVAVKENHYDPLWNDLGRGYVSGIGYYVFTDRGGDRIERAALGPSGYLIEQE